MIDLGVHVERVARHIFGEPNKKLSGRGELQFGTHGSLAVKIAGPKRGTWFDHEKQIGGGVAEMLLANGEAADKAGVVEWFKRELGIDVDAPQPRSAKPDAVYNYLDEGGKPLFQVLRWGPEKTFSQQQPGTGTGGIKRGPDGRATMEGARLVPYHLDELTAARARGNGHPWRCYIVEGEKDADRLRKWGLLATTNPGGASSGKSKWRADYNQYFIGSEAIILSDNDDTGRTHATAVAAQLTPVAAILKVIHFPHLPVGGNISDWIDDGGTQSDLEDLVDGTAPQKAEPPRQGKIQIHDAADIDVTKIPPRGWLLGTTFCRKFISGVIAEGAAGKTALRYAQLLACATGRNLTKEYVHQRCRVLIVCLEDDLDEVKRRIGAAMLHHKVPPEAVRGFLYYCTPRGLKLLQTDPQGARAAGELHQELREIVQALHIDVVSIDPFVKAHGVGENDNNAIDEVCIMLADLGDESDCAIDLASHARKGAATPGDADRDRGASSKKDAGRLMRTLTGMTTEEAELFGVAAAERPLLVRVDDAKVNLIPRSHDAMWFKLIGVPLGNQTDRYPNGDNIQTVEPWAPKDAFAKLNRIAIEQILNRIEAGPYEGGRYSPAAQATERAAWPAVQQFCPDLNEKQAKHVINTWLKNGVLVKQEYKDPKNSHDLLGLFVGKRPGDTWDA